MTLIALSGKGGVGKTSLAALILDELARSSYPGRVLAVDADPAMTLHLALGLAEPAATVAGVRDDTSLDAATLRALPAGMRPAGYLLEKLGQAGVLVKARLRQMPLDLMAMGQGEGPGCYCQINSALKTVLSWITQNYDLVLVDNEAGLEHLSRYRLGQVDLFLTVATPNPASQVVARRVVETARQMEIEIGTAWTILNRAGAAFQGAGSEQTLGLPHTTALAELEARGEPVIRLADDDPVRAALQPIVAHLRPEVSPCA